MKGQSIIANGNQPNGRFVTGILSGVLSPGQQLQIKAGVEPINGNFTYEACSTAGANKPAFILMEDNSQGSVATTAYVDGALAQLYVPISGDELNLLYKNIAGTADAFTIGELMVVDATGKFVADTGTPQRKHQCEETVAAITADTLVCTRWN